MIEPKILDIFLVAALAAITIGLWLAMYRTDCRDDMEEEQIDKKTAPAATGNGIQKKI